MPFKKKSKRSAAASNREAAKKGRGDRSAEAAAPDGENAANAKVGCGGSVFSADDERANGGKANDSMVLKKGKSKAQTARRQREADERRAAAEASASDAADGNADDAADADAGAHSSVTFFDQEVALQR